MTKRKSNIYTSTLRPGWLVNIKTSIKGNVSYDKSEEKVSTKGRTEVSTWETEKTVLDAKEQKLATEVRSKARNLVVGVCAVSEFGLLCPNDKLDELENAFDEARKLCVEFNKNAKVTSVKFNVLKGHVAANDIDAVRAINSEVRDLLAEMKAGVKELDVERVRDAANRTKKLGTMLAPEVQSRIEETLKVVRAQAVKIVKAGDQASTVIDRETIATLNRARTAFLDLDDAAVVQAPADTTGRALDLAPDAEAPKVAKKSKAREIELA